MRKKRAICIAVGAILILGAVGLFVGLRISSHESVANREATLTFLESVLPERSAGIKEERSNPVMPTVYCDGTDYVAIVEIPKSGVKLPIADRWNSRLVRSVPCRFAGTAYDGSLVIGGADDNEQFSFVSAADIGDSVQLTAMTGEVFTYRVKNVRHAKSSDAKTLTSGGGDLTLFAKSNSLGDMIMVICEAA